MWLKAPEQGVAGDAPIRLALDERHRFICKSFATVNLYAVDWSVFTSLPQSRGRRHGRMRWLASEPQRGSSDKRSNGCSPKSLQKTREHNVRSSNAFISYAVYSCQIAASSAVRALLALPQYKSAQRLSVYLSMPSGEIATSEIVHDALKSGKQLFVPYTYQLSQKVDGQPPSTMDMLEVKSIDDFRDFRADKWGIPVPGEDSVDQRPNSFGGTGKSEGRWPQAPQRAGLDLIVLPGMAFDWNMGRLGHGKGYYDHFLDRCQRQTEQGQTKMPFLGKTASRYIHLTHLTQPPPVGLALNEQLLPREDFVPTDDTDWKLDALVLGDGNVLLPEDR